MKKNYQKMGISIFSQLAILNLALLFINNSYAQTTLRPYTAIYSSSFKGLSAELNRSLKQNDNDRWSVSNQSSVLFTRFKEEASFLIRNNKLIPDHYNFNNPLSSKRNSKLRFDWEKGNATETAKSDPPINIPGDALDKLTFQIQLRLDLIAQGKDFKEKTYTLVEGNKLKPYVINYLGEETITTEAGTFTAARVKQQRPGKDKHTEIWLAKDWQYFILRIERFEKGKSRYKLKLESANINGQKMIAKTSAE